MALTPKPYVPTDLIIDAQFRGAPNILADVDINQYNQILEASIQMLWSQAGANISNVFAGTVSYNGLGQLVYDIPYPAFNVNIRGMEFQFPSGAFTGTAGAGAYTGVEIYLVATKVLITFADDPVISGITGTSLPTALAAADHYVYQTPRLAYCEVPNTPVLGTGEEVVCMVFSVIPQNINGALIPLIYTASTTGFAAKMLSLLNPGNTFNPATVNAASLIQYYLDYAVGIQKDPVGTVKVFYGAQAGNFDTTGKGIGPWTGWAQFNGNNGLPDWRGRVPVIWDNRLSNPGNGFWDASYNTPGNTIGAANSRTLEIANLPPHQHRTLDDAGSDYYTYGIGGGSAPALQHGPGSIPGDYMESEVIGEGVAVDIRPPLVVTVWVCRVF